MLFTNIAPEQITDNTFKLIGNDWMLVTGGTKHSHNCMTASWGGFGILWHKPVVFVFIRPQRYTNEFVEKHPYISLSFFDESYRPQMQLCGTKSGRTIDKAAACNFSIFETQHKAIAYQEARLVLECKILYAHQLQQDCFIDTSHLHHYAAGDFHIQYIAEITECLIR
ncbi:MAG TPA: flavin reductase [Bacteroidales bacterium]|nr:flavin reductase [Bacteroidales bacterium]